MTVFVVLAALAATVVLASGSLLRLPSLVGVGLGGLALAYAIGLHLLPGALHVPSAVVAGGGLLVAGELGFSGVMRPSRGDDARVAMRVRVRRPLAWCGACGLGGAAAAFVVAGIGSAATSRSALLTVAGAVAAGLAVWLVVRAARRAF